MKSAGIARVDQACTTEQSRQASGAGLREQVLPGPDGQESLDASGSFRLVHDGQELVVLSQPLRPDAAGVLTPAQIDVACAIARGASNAEIARMRGTSVRTVANQVASILVRLGATSRAQIALKLAFADLGRGEGKREAGR